ncbi:MAG: AAA family ATPase [Burkholderiaceae bacterium]
MGHQPTPGNEAPRALQVSLLGRFDVVRAGRSVLAGCPPLARRLLACLMLAPSRRVDRGEVAARFWPDSNEAQARTNLRRELRALRGLDPVLAEVLLADGTDIVVDLPAGSTLDIDALRRALERAASAEGNHERQLAAQRVSPLHAGDLLAGNHDDWAIEAREAWQRELADALRKAARAALAGDSPAAARTLLEHLVRIDPLDEPAHLDLMKALAALNERARAIHVYHQCASALARELDVAPDASLHEMYLHLRGDSDHAAAAGNAPPVRAGSRRRSVDEAPDALVGRQGAQAELLACWRSVAQDGIRMVSIEGEAGIGKTSVAHWLLAQAMRAHAHYAETRAFAARGGLAFAPVLDWLATPALGARLAQLSPPQLAEIAQIAPELIASDRVLASAPARGSPESSRRRLFDAMALAIGVNTDPTLLVLDDLQWADPDTLEWLRFLFHREPQAPVLVVATLRTEALARTGALAELLGALGQAGRLTRIELGRLTLAQTGTLVAGRLAQPARADAERAIERIHDRSGGNPFFIEQLVRAHTSSPGDASDRTAGEDAGALPPRLYAVIRARLDATSARARAVAEVAASIGRSFDVDILSATQVGTADDVVDALDELWRHKLIREVGNNAYLFVHDSVREAAYDALSPIRRRQLHRQIATAITSIHGDGSPAWCGQLAEHQLRAGLGREAVKSFGLAADAAIRRFAYRDALAHLESARTLLEQSPQGERGVDELVDTLCKLAGTHQFIGGFSAAQIGEICDRIEALLPRVASANLKFRALQRIRIFHSDRNIRRADAISRQSLRLAEQLGDSSALLHALHDAGFTAWMRGRLPEARVLLRRAVDELHAAIRAEQVDPSRLTQRNILVFALWAQFAWGLGDPDEILGAMAEFRGLNRAHCRNFERMFPEVFDARLCQLTGDTARIEPLIAWLREAGETEELLFAQLWSLELDGWRMCQCGDLAAGIDALGRAIDGMGPLMSMFQPLRLAMLAEALVDAGRGGEAVAAVADGLSIATRTGHRFWNAELYRLRAEAQQASNASPADVDRSIRLAIRYARCHGFVTSMRRCRLTRAAIWQARGQWAEARREADAIADEIDERIDPRAFATLAALRRQR